MPQAAHAASADVLSEFLSQPAVVSGPHANAPKPIPMHLVDFSNVTLDAHGHFFHATYTASRTTFHMHIACDQSVDHCCPCHILHAVIPAVQVNQEPCSLSACRSRYNAPLTLQCLSSPCTGVPKAPCAGCGVALPGTARPPHDHSVRGGCTSRLHAVTEPQSFKLLVQLAC